MEIIKIESKSLELRIDKPGIYEMTKEQYHADPCITPSLSRGLIVTMLDKSPLHMATEHPRLSVTGVNDDEGDDEGQTVDPKESTAMLIGDYVDHLLMGGEKRFAVLPFDKWTTKEAKAARDAAKAMGETPIKQKHHDTAAAMIKAFRERFTLERFPEMQEGFPSGGFQRVILWEEDGVWMRAMLDALGKHIWDYKSTAADAKPDNWIKNNLFGKSLEMQAAFYARGYKAVTGESKHFLFAVQEQKKPFDSYPVVVDQVDIADANAKITWARGVFKSGLETGHWDGYLTRIATASAPPWVRTQWEDFMEQQKTLAKIKADESVDLRAAG